MPHLVIVCESLAKGGAEKQLAQLAVKIKQYGYTTSIIAMFKGGYWHDWLQENNIPVYILNFKDLRTRHLKTWDKLFQLWRLLKSLKADIVLNFLYRPIIFSSAVAGLAQIPIIIAAYRSTGFEKAKLNSPQRIKAYARQKITHYTANSLAVKAHIMNDELIPEEKISIIHNGIDAIETGNREQFRTSLSIDADTILIGQLANFHTHKNQFQTIKTILKLLPQYQNIHVAFAGRQSSYFDECFSLVQDSEYSEHFHWLGEVDKPADFLAGIDIGVLTSRTEGFSNSILEYMVYGHPVLATNIGGTPEIVIHEETGFLVDVDDIHSSYDALAQLIENPQLRAEMGQKAQKRVSDKFSWEQSAKAYHQLFSTLLDQ